MPEVTITEQKVLAGEKFALKNICFEIRKGKDKWQKQKRDVFDHGNAVAALLYNKKRRTIILTSQFRIATFINGNPTGMLIEVCAGLLEQNEKPDDAIIREIEEETGFVIEKVHKIYETYSSAGSLTELLHLYIAEYTNDQQKTAGGGLEEEGEDIKVLELTFDSALEMMEKGEIKDAKTIILLQYLKLKAII